MWAAIRARLRRGRPQDVSPPDKANSNSKTASRGAAPPEPAPSAFSEGLFARSVDVARVEDVLDDLEIVLLQSDVALPVIEKIRRDVKKELAGKKLRWGGDLEAAVRSSLEESIRAVLSKPPYDLAERIRAHPTRPFVILFVGVNGTGKTTTVAKIAGRLRDAGLSVAIAAGDTFRAGAIEQLLVHGERLGVRVVRQQEGSDPAAVAFDAIEHAKAKSVDVVLVDTAGRQHTNENLIEEAKKIRRVAQPSLTLFVGDALSGNDVIEQAKLFQSALGIDGIVLTKLDADTKGGASLSLAFVTGKPIVLVGTGQRYEDIAPFDPEAMVERLFDEGTSA
ncbi:MAG: signal recognition particle-docking protein FtsY [Thermoplasmata archaeon]|nr:signal recognition particle-docking protein FtsY [Thermoplasmata archaeon]MCI4359366.1 signal recognition particle-docking protein FtsY [Thermoplasmata archaeon]